MDKIKRKWLLIVLQVFLASLSCHGVWAGGAQRIVSLGPTNTENVFLLGAGKRLVGNTRYCVRPEAARHKAKIGSVMQVSVEKIISLQPELILATAFTKPSQVKQLEKIGYQVVRFARPTSFKQICRQFIELGRLLDLEEQARQIVIKAQNDVDLIQQRVAGLPPQQVFLQIGTTPLFGATPESFTHDFIHLSGGINILADQDRGTVNTEKIIAANPDLIIIAIMGSEAGIAAAEQEKWQQISVLKARQDGRIHIINPNLVCSPSPATFAQTLGVFADLIHPLSKTRKIN